jgi:dTMP kinase
LDWLIKLNDNFLLPDLTFFLKVSPEICIQRIEKRREVKTFFEKKEKLEKVYQAYQSLLNRFENIYIINGEKSIEDVFFQIKKYGKDIKKSRQSSDFGYYGGIRWQKPFAIN